MKVRLRGQGERGEGTRCCVGGVSVLCCGLSVVGEGTTLADEKRGRESDGARCCVREAIVLRCL